MAFIIIVINLKCIMEGKILCVYLSISLLIFLGLMVSELIVGYKTEVEDCDMELFMTRSNWLIVSGFSRLAIGIFVFIMYVILSIYMCFYTKNLTKNQKIVQYSIMSVLVFPHLFIELAWPFAGIYLVAKSMTCYTLANINAMIVVSSTISIVHMISLPLFMYFVAGL